MVARFKQLTRQLNSLKTKKRYKEKRERRGFLTEAYLDGELALYKPTHTNYWQYLRGKLQEWDKKKYDKIRIAKEIEEREKKYKVQTFVNPNVSFTKLSWFEKLLLFIRNMFKK
jgi:hypothetical protein